MGVNRYPSYKPSGVPWIGDVPDHWRIVPGRNLYVEKKVPNKGLKETQVLSLSYGKIRIRGEEELHGLVPASFESYQMIEPGDIICRPTDLQNDWNSLRFGLSPIKGSSPPRTSALKRNQASTGGMDTSSSTHTTSRKCSTGWVRSKAKPRLGRLQTPPMPATCHP